MTPENKKFQQKYSKTLKNRRKQKNPNRLKKTGQNLTKIASICGVNLKFFASRISQQRENFRFFQEKMFLRFSTHSFRQISLIFDLNKFS